MLRLCFLVLSFSWIGAFGQTDSIQYFDAYDRSVHKESAIYYRRISEPDSNKIYTGAEYWLDGHIKMTGHSLDPFFYCKIGRFSYYYKNGVKSGEGQFYSSIEQHVFGFKNKKWETWYPNGKPKEEWIYHIAEDFSYSESFLMTFWDSTGQVLTSKGNGRYYYTEPVSTKDSVQKIIFTGPIHQGRYDSVWRDNYNNGKLYAEEVFKDGKLIKGRSFDGSGNAYDYDSLESQPHFPGGIEELTQFFKLNLQVPQLADSRILQKIYLRVFIGRTGFVGNATVLRGTTPEMNGEAIRVAKSLPRFIPATNRGQPVDAYYNIPVSFNVP